jgi:hypothetical protein
MGECLTDELFSELARMIFVQLKYSWKLPQKSEGENSEMEERRGGIGG